ARAYHQPSVRRGHGTSFARAAPQRCVAWQTFASLLVAAGLVLRGEKIVTIPAMVVPGAVSVPDRRCGGVAEPGCRRPTRSRIGAQQVPRVVKFCTLRQSSA